MTIQSNNYAIYIMFPIEAITQTNDVIEGKKNPFNDVWSICKLIPLILCWILFDLGEWWIVHIDLIRFNGINDGNYLRLEPEWKLIMFSMKISFEFCQIQFLVCISSMQIWKFKRDKHCIRCIAANKKTKNSFKPNPWSPQANNWTIFLLPFLLLFVMHFGWFDIFDFFDVEHCYAFHSFVFSIHVAYA